MTKYSNAAALRRSIIIIKSKHVIRMYKIINQSYLILYYIIIVVIILSTTYYNII
jgi:hypothetical protein